MTPRLRLIIALALAAAPLGCGPSLRRTAQSDDAFVRCFDLDSDRSAPDAEKRRCWADWLDRRVYNQYDDKIRHAKMRIDALKGETPPAKER